MKMNDASQATGAQRPRTGACYRGDCSREGSPLCCHPPALPEKSQCGSGTAGGNWLTRGGRVLGVGVGCRPGGGTGPRDHLRQPTASRAFTPAATGPQAPACFDRDVTSYFFFRFLDQKCFALLQPRGRPGSFPPLRCAVLTARELLKHGHFRGLLWASRTGPKSRPPAAPPPIAPPPASPPRHPACLSLVGLRR